jgi:hypothetical protein
MDFIDAELVSMYSNSVKHFMEIVFGRSRTRGL